MIVLLVVALLRLLFCSGVQAWTFGVWHTEGRSFQTSLAISNTYFSSNSRDGRYSEGSSAYQRARERIQSLQSDLRTPKPGKALLSLSSMLRIIQETTVANAELDDLANMVDRSFQLFCSQRWTASESSELFVGIDALALYWSHSNNLPAAIRNVPRSIVFRALQALTNPELLARPATQERALKESYQLLQRLVSGVGVRHTQAYATEYEFTQVLNAYCECGDMKTAHRIMALHERHSDTTISPVSYSILLKGYGKLKDLDQVEFVYALAVRNQVEMDSVFVNTLLNSMVQCDATERAERAMDELQGTGLINRRSYNILLKGYAGLGDLKSAMDLSEEMRRRKLWDSVTTNTLVHAALCANKEAAAEDILQQHTLRTQKQFETHPNVEAYTELLDYYARTSRLDLAFKTFRSMQKQSVLPNEVTYTCLLGGLGRSRKLDFVRPTFQYMASNGVRPTAKMYGAIVAGLVNDPSMKNLNVRIDEALAVLVDMMKDSIRPDAGTVAVLVRAMGRCEFSRVDEARRIVDKLCDQQVIDANDSRVGTAFVQSYGLVGDAKAAKATFEKLDRPDTVAVNAFLDACFRCNQVKAARETFDHFFSKNKLKADVASYTIMIEWFLSRYSALSYKEARSLYYAMREAGLRLDSILVDCILKNVLDPSVVPSLKRPDIRFIVDVVADAENIRWETGQLERRQRAVKAVVGDRIVEVYGQDVIGTNGDDPLFQQKGWNQVDSGFKLWGGNNEMETSDTQGEPIDSFLDSHGWNDVDSGFRLF